MTGSESLPSRGSSSVSEKVMPHSLKDYDELHDGQGHLVRDSEEASRALEWVQQILEKDQDEHHGGVERKGTRMTRRCPSATRLQPSSGNFSNPSIRPTWPGFLRPCLLDERLAVWNLVKSESDGDILVEVNDGVRETLIDAMDRDELVDAVETLDTDEIADLVDDLPPDVMAQVQEGLSTRNAPSFERPCRIRRRASARAWTLRSFRSGRRRRSSSCSVTFAASRALPDHTDQVFVVDRLGHLKGHAVPFADPHDGSRGPRQGPDAHRHADAQSS